MRVVSLSQGSRSDKTFALALVLLAAIACAQVIGALAIRWHHAHEVRPSFVPAPDVTVAASKFVAPAATKPIAKTKSASRLAPAVSIPDELLQVARALRKKGDTGNAIAKLQQAAALAPQNAEILAELALTYESMQLFDRSNETWRRVKSLGDDAGALGELADLKLRMGVPVAGIPGSTGQASTGRAAPDDSTSIPDGSVLGISRVKQTLVDDPDVLTKLVLRVGVTKRQGATIDHTKVKIQVFFYDVVDNNQVVLTDADVSYEWITPGHNWADTPTEVLDVTYVRPKNAYPAPGSPLENVPDSVEKAQRAAKKKSNDGGADLLPKKTNDRQYLGYIVRVYYEDELQAVRADPTRLLNLFPPPVTAPPQ
ncbi:MAG TPA: tetratricopeptide repeat protein [Chthoniobacterales bacterium]